MITDVDEYFLNGCGRCERFSTPECSARLWHNGLLELRRICLDSGLKETAKWGQPCYMYETRNIVIIGAFQKDFRLSFFNASLMRDPEGILERSGPNTQHPGIIRFTATGDVLEKEGIIHAYIQEAIEYVKSGVQPKKQIEALVLPIELEEALACDIDLANAFYSLTPGRQKSYIINLNSAKKSETRVSRIAKYRDNIMTGKGATEF